MILYFWVTLENNFLMEESGLGPFFVRKSPSSHCGKTNSKLFTFSAFFLSFLFYNYGTFLMYNSIHTKLILNLTRFLLVDARTYSKSCLMSATLPLPVHYDFINLFFTLFRHLIYLYASLLKVGTIRKSFLPSSLLMSCICSCVIHPEYFISVIHRRFRDIVLDIESYSLYLKIHVRLDILEYHPLVPCRS